MCMSLLRSDNKTNSTCRQLSAVQVYQFELVVYLPLLSMNRINSPLVHTSTEIRTAFFWSDVDSLHMITTWTPKPSFALATKIITLPQMDTPALQIHSRRLIAPLWAPAECLYWGTWFINLGRHENLLSNYTVPHTMISVRQRNKHQWETLCWKSESSWDSS